MDEVPAAGISSTSPFISIDSESVNEEQFDTPYPAISFELTVARNTPAGEYSILLQSAEGEIVYLVGALTIDDAAEWIAKHRLGLAAHPLALNPPSALTCSRPQQLIYSAAALS